MLIKHLLWRNTKEEIKLFHSVPPSEEETIFAEFSMQERQIYDSKFLLCFPNDYYFWLFSRFQLPEFSNESVSWQPTRIHREQPNFQVH